MVTFRDYMESALYDPARGFYSTRRPKRDFFTAPELTEAFAAIVARWVLERFSECDKRSQDPFTIVEMGSGSGLFARQLLEALAHASPEAARRLRYILVERSRGLLLESMTKLSSTKTRLLGYTRLADLEPCRGVFFSNELVDAFPVHVLEKTFSGVSELFVGDSGILEPGKISDPRLSEAAGALSEMPEGTRHAVNLEASEWISEVSSKITAGWLLTIDYGSRYLKGVPNPPRTFSRHAAGSELTQPGADITANVDFERLIEQGKKCGLKLKSYTTLARFLLDHGVEDFFARDPLKVKTLVHPEAMGEVYKVLTQSKGI